MENIYKIKIRSNPSPRELFPSERRYSSSIVLGLSIMFLALSATSALMGTLVVRRLAHNETANATDRLLRRVEADLPPLAHPLNLPAVVTAGAFVMSLGQLLAGLFGALAWKRWYVDRNITWFFLSACFSSVTSSISLLLVGLTLLDARGLLGPAPPVSPGLAANILITSLLGLVWSVVATNVAFRGMKSSYPDDLVLAKGRGRVEVSTVRKGSKVAVVPPDILNHFPRHGKLAKFFPRRDGDGDLPKAESNKEYEERVKKFLNSDSCADKN